MARRHEGGGHRNATQVGAASTRSPVSPLPMPVYASTCMYTHPLPSPPQPPPPRWLAMLPPRWHGWPAGSQVVVSMADRLPGVEAEDLPGLVRFVVQVGQSGRCVCSGGEGRAGAQGLGAGCSASHSLFCCGKMQPRDGAAGELGRGMSWLAGLVRPALACEPPSPQGEWGRQCRHAAAPCRSPPPRRPPCPCRAAAAPRTRPAAAATAQAAATRARLPAATAAALPMWCPCCAKVCVPACKAKRAAERGPAPAAAKLPISGWLWVSQLAGGEGRGRGPAHAA